MAMTNLSLVHYYFGEREKTFLIGLGIILRAKGHSKPVSILLIDDLYPWINNFKIEDTPQVIIDLRDSKIDVKRIFLDTFSEVKDTVCLIVNFDLLIEKEIMSLQSFLQVIKSLDTSNELILTSEQYYEGLEEFADYVSGVKEI
jgi:ATP:corrinoid adenosyltransferase